MLLLLLEAARRQRREALILEYQYRLFALRDHLRENAMKNPKLGRNWVFQYYDSTIAKSIRLLPELNIWNILFLLICYRNDESLDSFSKSLVRELGKEGNQVYKKLEEDFSNLLAEFVVSRHILILIVSTGALVLPVAVARIIQELKRRSVEVILESPETSTLNKFAPSY